MSEGRNAISSDHHIEQLPYVCIPASSNAVMAAEGWLPSQATTACSHDHNLAMHASRSQQLQLCGSLS